MSDFIRYVNPVIAKDAEINKLRAEVRKLRADNALIEAESQLVRAAIEDAESAEPDCTDLCALENTLCDAEYDLLDIQGMLGGELKIGATWNCKLAAKGLSTIATILREIAEIAVCKREHELTIAAHNLAFCKAMDADLLIEDRKAALAVLVAANPDMDARCARYIEEVLLKACA